MSDSVYLVHHGIKGQEHGHRRFQNYDGSLTPEGRERYGVGDGRTKSSTPQSTATHKSLNELRAKIKSSKAYIKSQKVAKGIKKDVTREFKNAAKSEAIKTVKKTGSEAVRSVGAFFVANNVPAMMSKLSSQAIAAGSASTSSILSSGVIPMAAIGVGAVTSGYAVYKYMKSRKDGHLAHHGIKGQEHGHRRFQNYDGSLTPEGRERYGVGPARKVAQTVGKIKKSISDAKEAKLERQRNRNERMRVKVERIKESAYLKEEEKRLKKEMKRAKKEGTKEAKGKYSRNDIKSLTNEEIQARLNRLQQESKLAAAEMDRNMSPLAKAIREAMVKGGAQAVSTIAQNTLTDLGKKYLKVDISAGAKTTKDIENSLRDEFNLQKLKDEMADYAQTREDNEVKRKLTRAQNERDLLKARNEVDTYDQTRKDDELRRKVTRAQNFRDLVSAKKSSTGMYKSAEDKSKEQARKLAERKELERRAANYVKNMSQEEAAEHMNITLAELKDLLYVK